jgi:ACR3 family arsenite efflux pump ArsB
VTATVETAAPAVTAPALGLFARLLSLWGAPCIVAGIALGHLFAPWLPPAQAESYLARLLLLAAAPCTAMVFVWSPLTRGDP